MKFIFVFFGLLSATSFQASAKSISNFDGCYQLYMPSTMYPVVCVQGTTEEGINGSEARVTLFHVNSSEVETCFKTTASGVNGTANSYFFEVKGVKEMIFSKVEIKDGRKIGDVTFGKTTLKFMERLPEHTVRFIKIANTKCEW